MVGNVVPETVKPAPMTPTELMVNAALPDEVRVRVFVEVVFRVTLPKPRLAWLTINCGVEACVPVPLRATVVALPVEELLEIVIDPLAAPATVGSKVTWSVTD